MKKVCMTPGCGKKQSKRGVCDACYVSHRRSIDDMETTDEELVESELWLPAYSKKRSKARRALER